MNFLITGGSGLIGQSFTKWMLHNHHQIWILSRNPDSANLPAGVKGVQWDGKTTTGWLNIFESMDAVINLAGENIGGGLWTEKRKKRILDSRVLAGRAITEAFQLAKNRPGVLVQASAVGIYGVEFDEVLPETAPAGKDWLAGVAREWEASTDEVSDLGVRRVTIRTGLVLSQRGGVLPKLLLPFRLMVGGKMGSGRQWMPWIHIMDEVRAIQYLLELNTARGVYNLAAPNPVTNAEFSKIASRVLHRPAWFSIPGPILRAVLGEMSTLLLDGQRAIPQRLLEDGFQFRFNNLEPALEDLVRSPKIAD